jgi:hypothetical protein
MLALGSQMGSDSISGAAGAIPLIRPPDSARRAILGGAQHDAASPTAVKGKRHDRGVSLPDLPGIVDHVP